MRVPVRGDRGDNLLFCVCWESFAPVMTGTRSLLCSVLYDIPDERHPARVERWWAESDGA